MKHLVINALLFSIAVLVTSKAVAQTEVVENKLLLKVDDASLIVETKKSLGVDWNLNVETKKTLPLIPNFPIFAKNLLLMTELEMISLKEEYYGLPVEGVSIKSALPIVEGDMMILTDAPFIKKIGTNGDSTLFTTYDENHKATSKYSVYIADSKGRVHCTIADVLDGVTSPIITQRYQILIDVSGSMDGFMPDVKQAVSHFINAMDKSAFCRVATFSSSYQVYRGNNGYKGWQPCDASFWSWTTILQPNGSTEAFNALQKSYTDLSEPHPALAKDAELLSALVVLSDGDGLTQTQIDPVKAMKAEIPTLTYFAGNENHTAYTQFSDQYLSAAAGVNIQDAFTRFSETAIYARKYTPGNCKSSLAQTSAP